MGDMRFYGRRPPSLEQALIIILLAVIIWVIAMAVPPECRGESLGGAAKKVAVKVADTSWLGRKATKYGFIIAVCSTNSLRMAKEADNFDSRDLLGKNTYHTINALEILGWIASGYMLYAVIEREDWTWKDKTQLVGGTLSLAREFGEFTYQGLRRNGDFLNNNPDWHKNELTWFTSKASFPWVQDRMIATGKVSTPALHLGFTALGASLLGGVQ